jgi:probable HAF family extracellular repeat protein
MHDLGTLPQFPNSYATAISEDGAIVGYSGTQSGSKWSEVSGPGHAWVWWHGRMRDLGTLPGTNSSFAFAINGADTIVGCSGDIGPNIHLMQGNYNERRFRAVAWIDRRIVDLNALIPAGSGWLLQCAHGVNDAGWIVGDGLYHGQPRAFVLKPLAG